MPRLGMNARDMPTAATSEAGRTSTQNEPLSRTSDSPTRPNVSTPIATTRVCCGPNRAITRGATTIMPSMIRTVIGSKAAPEGNAE